MTIKYLLAPAMALIMIGCQANEGDQVSEQGPDEQTMQDQFQQEQASPDIDVSDEELEQFVEVSSVVQGVQMEIQMEMVSIVEDEGLEVETYNQIAEARQMGQADEELDVSPEELEKFESASESIAEVEKELESKMTTVVEDEGMEMDRFMAINMALQQDQSLQQRVQEIMMESQMQQQQGQPGTE